MRDISKLFSSSAVLRKSQPILIKSQVASCTCTHRSNCQENLLGTGGSVLLHPSPPGWSPAEGVMMIWRKQLSRSDRNGDVEVWGVVGPAHYSIRNKTSRLGRASQNGSQVGFIAKSRLPLNKQDWNPRGGNFSPWPLAFFGLSPQCCNWPTRSCRWCIHTWIENSLNKIFFICPSSLK